LKWEKTEIDITKTRCYVKYINSNLSEQAYKALELKGEWGGGARNTNYYVKKYQFIDGDGTNNLLDANGRLISNGVDETERIAYIVGRTRVQSSAKYLYPTITQVMMWNTQLHKKRKKFSYNTFLNDHDKDTGCKDKDADNAKIEAFEAEIEVYENYIKELNKYSGPSIVKGNVAESINGEYTILGPINIKFLQDGNTATRFAGVGTIYKVGDIQYPNTGNQMYNVNHNDPNAIKVVDASGNEIDRTKWSLVDSSGNIITEEIQSEKDFYVKILSTERSKAAKVTFNFYTAKINITRAVERRPSHARPMVM